MARLPDFAQGIVVLDVGPWFGSQRQSLGRLYRRRVRRLPVDQAVQQVQDMGLRRGAGLQRQFDGGEQGLFVMLEDQAISRSLPGVLSVDKSARPHHSEMPGCVRSSCSAAFSNCFFLHLAHVFHRIPQPQSAAPSANRSAAARLSARAFDVRIAFGAVTNPIK
jgi:hypothetical protein